MMFFGKVPNYFCFDTLVPGDNFKSPTDYLIVFDLPSQISEIVKTAEEMIKDLKKIRDRRLRKEIENV